VVAGESGQDEAVSDEMGCCGLGMAWLNWFWYGELMAGLQVWVIWMLGLQDLDLNL
jgi:hypothetical protein